MGLSAHSVGGKDILTRSNPRPTRFRCRPCRKDFSVKTNTLMHNSPLPLSKWAIAFYLYNTNLKGVSSMKLHRGLEDNSEDRLVHAYADSGILE